MISALPGLEVRSMPPNAPVGRRSPAPALLLLVLSLVGCSNIVSPGHPSDTHHALLLAVTAPESLVAGSVVTLYAHCGYEECGDGPPFAVVHTPRPDSGWVEVWATRPEGVWVCLPEVAFSRSWAPLQVRLPV